MREEFKTLREDFNRDGFVVVRNFLTPNELAELQRELARYIRDVLQTQPANHAFYQDRARPETLKQFQFTDDDAYFAAYRKHPKWVALWEALVSKPAGDAVPKWFNKPPPGSTPGKSDAEHPTPAHQDNFYAFYEPCDYATIWLALDPVTSDNGGLHYVPGSHFGGYRPHNTTAVLGFSQGITNYGPADTAREVAIRLNPGDAVAHHGMTIHRADANRTPDRHRRAFTIEMTAIGIQQNEAAYRKHREAVATQHAKLGVNPR